MKKLWLWCVLMLVPATTGTLQAQNWLANWAYRSQVNISNSNGTLSNFQVQIRLSSDFDFAKANPDGSDLRFTSSDGTTALPFWIESWDANNEQASVWVKLPSIGSSATIYLYYGNFSAVSASSGADTFDFFDDFDTAGSAAAGYFDLGPPETVMVRDQFSWEATPPHTLSVVQSTVAAGYTYTGYYGLEDGCGGVGVAFSNDLVNWVKYGSNPLFVNGRWPSVLKVSNTFYMLYEKDFCQFSSYIVLASSTDGMHFTDVKTLVQPEPGFRNHNPNLFFNSRDGKYYIYWFRGDDATFSSIKARSASTIEDLDTASDATVLQTAGGLAAPNMYYDSASSTFFLATEFVDQNKTWAVRVYSSTNPTSGFTELPANPVLADGAACMFQHAINGTLHNYYCKQTDNVWTLEHRTAQLTGPRTRALDPAKWQSAGGAWGITTDVQHNGKPGGVAKGIVGLRSGYRVLFTPNYSGGDYVLDAHVKQLSGRSLGLGARLVDPTNFYSVNLYEDLDNTANLYSYKWLTEGASVLTSAPVGPVGLNTWSRLRIAAHGSKLSTFKDDAPVAQLNAADSTFASGGVALYGEEYADAEFDDVLVRKHAEVDVGVTVNAGTPQPLSSVTVAPASVIGGQTVTGTVTLTTKTGSDTTVTLTSNKTSATVPVSVVVPANSKSANFTISTNGVDSVDNATITATLGGISQTTTLAVTPAALSDLALSAASVLGGSTIEGTVSLNGIAGPSGATVSLGSNNAAAAAPVNVKVPAGQSSATFAITTSPVSASTTARITASYAGISFNRDVAVIEGKLVTLVINPTAVVGGTLSQGTVTLNAPAGPQGALVTLSSDTSAASIPAKVTIPSGATSSSFSIASSPVSAKTVATINASRGASLSATITLNPAGLSGLEVSTAKVKINGSALATVTLDSPAGPQGAIIALASSNAGVASVPATVIVPAGAKSAAFNITAGTISTETAVTISATLNGVTKTVPISVVVPGFTLATQTDSAATIIAGQTAIYNLSAAGTNDFSGTVALTCSGAPQGSTCSVTPNPLTVSGAAASSFTVSVTTTARVSTAAAAGSIKPNLPGGSGGAALFWIGLLAMTTFVASMRIVPVRRQLGVVAACAMLFAVAGLTGCGGGGTGSRQTPSFSPPSQTGTPAGTYAVVVTGVSGSQTQTLQLTLKVN